ncbi:MAG: DUF3024 domain-containing protein [Desulfuromonadales bacterium]|nr:DUF3024 domain-containing protein [Desulfuromonadales bacterium]MBN2792597.1 DUF3024 domain-containing protein [Desulfuromonadales bacterium]
MTSQFQLGEIQGSELPQLLERKAVKLLDEFCIKAAHDKYQPRLLRYRIEGRQVLIYEIRRLAKTVDQHRELPMAKLRYTPELNQWSLHHQKGEYWQLYLNVPPTLDFSKLLDTIRQDPMGYFWQD